MRLSIIRGFTAPFKPFEHPKKRSKTKQNTKDNVDINFVAVGFDPKAMIKKSFDKAFVCMKTFNERGLV